MDLKTVDKKVFSYADDVNTTYTVENKDEMTTEGLLSPSLYFNYFLNDNLFLQYETGIYAYKKDYTVSYKDNLVAPISKQHIYNYQFLSNKLSIGYRFMRTKAMRAKVYGGPGMYSLLQLNERATRTESHLLKNIAPYGQVIHKEVNRINNNFYTWHVGVGIDYYLLSFEMSYEKNFSAVDTTPSESYYQSSETVIMSLGIRLFNGFVKGKKVKYETL